MEFGSIFTYETEIPRLSSPWLKQSGPITCSAAAASKEPASYLDDEGNVIRLEPEPQEGPVEYKLHLLLRPRRNYNHLSTVSRISGSKHSKFNGPAPRDVSEHASMTPPGTSSLSTQQTRQHRLEQLTTQLLWRLQQSAPHHSNSATNVVLPSFPEASSELQAPPQPAKLVRGLEESQGALYEIGVSDDGTLVGLAEDEMEESLNNLRAMAACLGCVVDVQKLAEVGFCSWADQDGSTECKRVGRLLVAEAFIQPCFDGSIEDGNRFTDQPASSVNNEPNEDPTPQLRITLTGATMSGKSSLLGALSTATLDNGRGQSRLSMLRHRHEINSGITSSVSQEMFGYRDRSDGDVEVINYATKHIASWIDMHANADRLVFISDSAGHPRYRRTTVRGLVGWKPHWTILCIPADDEDTSCGRAGHTPSCTEVLGPAAGNVDLSAAHLELCLRLGMPLVVVITKLDLASKTGLRMTLAKLLSSLKAVGKVPIIVPNSPGAAVDEDLKIVSRMMLESIRSSIKPIFANTTSHVPILMTSAVQGAGFDVLHALLHELPLTLAPVSPASVHTLFHIEDVYNKALDSKTIVVSGHLERGVVSVGDVLHLGPCSPSVEDSDDSDAPQRVRIDKPLSTSRSFPGALKASSHLSPRPMPDEQEWRRVAVISIRNLRLPVNTLRADQVGTIGLQVLDSSDVSMLAAVKIRKGMVLCEKPAKSSGTIVAEFRRGDLGSLAIGSQVVAYIASVRTPARILSAKILDYSGVADSDISSMTAPFKSRSDHGLVAELAKRQSMDDDEPILVTMHFDASREYISAGSRILVMPGGGPGLFGGIGRGEKGVAGLEGFVGTVTESYTQ